MIINQGHHIQNRGKDWIELHSQLGIYVIFNGSLGWKGAHIESGDWELLPLGETQKINASYLSLFRIWRVQLGRNHDYHAQKRLQEQSTFWIPHDSCHEHGSIQWSSLKILRRRQYSTEGV